MMRQHLKTIGAPLAQTGLRRQRKNPTHGVVAGAANNALPCVGAALAQDASRAHPNSPAPRHQCSASGDALLPHRSHHLPADQRRVCRPAGRAPHARVRVHNRDQWIINAAIGVRLQRQGRRLVSTATIARSAARVTHAFARSSRTNTATRSTTHQRTREAACPFPPCARRLRSVSLTAGRNALSPVFAVFHASSRRLICALGRPWEGLKDIYARDVAAAFTVYLLEEREGQALGETWLAAEMHGIGPEARGAAWGVGGPIQAAAYLDLLSLYTAASFQIGAALFSKISGVDFLAAAFPENVGGGHD